jgi:hypothetical protein
MKLLTFQVRRFWWKTFSRTLPDVEEADIEEEVAEAVVVFFHAEAHDDTDERRDRVFRKTLKHIKWVANKRPCKTVVLHSFTHLGGDTATPDYAQGFVERMTARLEGTGYEVRCTPFGYFCAWEISVLGESMAKVFKEI